MKIQEHLIPILTMIEPTKDWEKMTINDWVDHLVNGNKLTIKYLPMNGLSGFRILIVLSKFPEKANDDNIDWEKLSGWDWALLLRKQPQFSVYCENYWDKLNGHDWLFLLQKQPQLAIYRKE